MADEHEIEYVMLEKDHVHSKRNLHGVFHANFWCGSGFENMDFSKTAEFGAGVANVVRRRYRNFKWEPNSGSVFVNKELLKTLSRAEMKERFDRLMKIAVKVITKRLKPMNKKVSLELELRKLGLEKFKRIDLKGKEWRKEIGFGIYNANTWKGIGLNSLDEDNVEMLGDNVVYRFNDLIKEKGIKAKWLPKFGVVVREARESIPIDWKKLKKIAIEDVKVVAANLQKDLKKSLTKSLDNTFIKINDVKEPILEKSKVKEIQFEFTTNNHLLMTSPTRDKYEFNLTFKSYDEANKVLSRASREMPDDKVDDVY